MSIELMSRVWKETSLRGTELLVLLCLADHANDDGICWPSYKRISERARSSPRWAMQCVKNLEAQGFVVREKRGNVGVANTYRITVPPAKVGGEVSSPPPTARGVKPSSPTREPQFTPPPLYNSTPGVNPSSHESSVEPSENHKESAPVPVAFVLFEEVYAQVVASKTTNEILAIGLAQRWHLDHGHVEHGDWKAHLTTWLKSA